MASDELMSIVSLLKKQGIMDFIEGATKEQIETFEKANNIQLPNQYREWLQFSDGGECFLPAGVQFYGVSHKPLIDVNYNNRPSEHYIVIGALSSGDPILCETEGERISIYNSAAGRIEDDEKYDDFYAFLKDLYVLLGIGE